MKSYYRVQAEIDLDAICENIKNTKRLLTPGTKVMGIIKADGYGHGAIPVAKAVGDDFDAYGVAILEEGVELREAGFHKPILILGYTPEPLYRDMIHYDMMPTVFTYEMAEKISKEALRQNRRVLVHIKLDTGMGRIGFAVSRKDAKEILKIAKLPNLEIAGCFSHFSKADEEDKAYTYHQMQAFDQMIAWLSEGGLNIPVRHISNSAGIIDLPEANFSMVRSGISTYGLYPSEEVCKERLPLRAALSLRSFVCYVKTVEAGSLIGYGGTFCAERETRVATIPVGYADGYRRELSNRGRVLICGESAPIIGRVCMDQFMVDVTDLSFPVREGETVTLIGEDGKEWITAEEIGALTHSFNYEVACEIGKRVPRVYTFHGKPAGTCDYYHTAKAAFALKF